MKKIVQIHYEFEDLSEAARFVALYVGVSQVEEAYFTLMRTVPGYTSLKTDDLKGAFREALRLLSESAAK